MRTKVAADFAAIAGITLVGYGAGMIYEPAGFIAGGDLLLLGAVVGALRGVEE